MPPVVPASGLVSACETRPLKVLATRRYPGPAFEELADVEIGSLAELHAPRPDVEALLVANEALPLELLPGLRLVANFGVGYDRLDAPRASSYASSTRSAHASTPDWASTASSTSCSPSRMW